MNTVIISGKMPSAISDCVEARWKSLGYPSKSAYVVGLIIYDLMSLREHSVTVALALKPTADQDDIHREIARMYNLGERSIQSSWFKGLLREAVAEAGLPEEPKKESVADKMLNRMRAKKS
jgi:hypothetical protein